MAMSTSLGDVDLKVHYEYYGKERCSPISMEFNELQSLGFFGLEALVKTQISYLRRMPSVRMSYRDEEGDYVDLYDKNFTRFLRTVRNTSEQKDVSTINIRVAEVCSPAIMQKQSCSLEEFRPSNSRKGLDFNQSSHTDEDATNVFTYKSPLEYSISNLKEEVEELEAQVESAKEHFDNLTTLYNNPTLNKGRGKQCSNCHLKLDHNIRQCTLDKCLTSQQCGDVGKHPEEKQLLDNASDQIKKLEKELKSKSTEYETRMKGLSSARISFSAKIRGVLINSNKEKYLVKTGDGMFVPKSALVNTDIAKLEKYFKGKVPDNIDAVATTFKSIINNFDKEGAVTKIAGNKNPAKRSLEENSLYPVKFPMMSATATQSAFQPVNTQGTPTTIPLQPGIFPIQGFSAGAMPVFMYQQGSSPTSTGQQTTWFVSQTPDRMTPTSAALPPKKRHSD